MVQYDYNITVCSETLHRLPNDGCHFISGTPAIIKFDQPLTYGNSYCLEGSFCCTPVLYFSVDHIFSLFSVQHKTVVLVLVPVTCYDVIFNVLVLKHVQQIY
jgi:hypothetical protein